MAKYVIKRLLIMIPILLGVTFIVFAIMALTPGDPARLLLDPNATADAIEKLRGELGWNDPFLVRYAHYALDMFSGDFGKSYRTGLPVFTEVLERFPVTLKLATLSVLFVTFFGILLGILSAVKQYSILDVLSRTLAMFAASIPGFWLGLMLILLFSLQLGWLPSYGVESWKSYILPVITLSLPSTAELLRITRSTMLETIRQDYIKTARAKGLQEPGVVWHHALKNALLPIVTIVGGNFGGLLGGAVLVESVFALPGLGDLVVTSIRMKDIPQVMAATLLIAFLYCIILLLVDIAYAFIDPRIRSRYS